jgi:hypothetical protein
MKKVVAKKAIKKVTKIKKVATKKVIKKSTSSAKTFPSKNLSTPLDVLVGISDSDIRASLAAAFQISSRLTRSIN